MPSEKRSTKRSNKRCSQPRKKSGQHWHYLRSPVIKRRRRVKAETFLRLSRVHSLVREISSKTKGHRVGHNRLLENWSRRGKPVRWSCRSSRNWYTRTRHGRERVSRSSWSQTVRNTLFGTTWRPIISTTARRVVWVRNRINPNCKAWSRHRNDLLN